MKKKFVGNGILKDITRLIIETDEENPVPIAMVDYNEIQSGNGYMARLNLIIKLVFSIFWTWVIAIAVFSANFAVHV
ncbi:MAG: hypothetical protein ACLT4I_11145 [Megamonas funiformis]|uniref:hypothetical protein n=1 Tax=Megamonas funiformis TaxID=437897 RepID=UPI003995EF4E